MLVDGWLLECRWSVEVDDGRDDGSKRSDPGLFTGVERAMAISA